jgi:transcriptional regulator with XRE-family HTH domain
MIAEQSLQESEMSEAATISPEQSRMARAGLGWGVRELADAAGVSTNTVTRFERGEDLRPRTVAVLRSTLEAAGAQFLEADTVAVGPGVALAGRGGSEPPP